MKIWVPGADGDLGTCVVQAAKDAGHDPIGTTHEQCSIEDPAMVFATVETLRPDVIINCAGKLPGSNPVEMMVANAVGPHVLAATRIRLVHMSTDCVFSGHQILATSPSYSSMASPNPSDFYGRSKLAGEPNYPHALTIRGSFISREGGFLAWLLNAKGPIETWMNAYWNGGTARAMAKWLVKLAESSRIGVVHVAAPGRITKAAMVQRLVGALDLGITSIRYVDEPRVFRVLLPDFELPAIDEMLEEVIQEIRNA